MSAHQSIKEQLERAVSLAPVLGPESDQNDLTFAVSDIDHCRLIGQVLFSDEPTALEEIPILVADYSLIPLIVLARRDLEGQAGPEEDRSL